MRKKRVVILGGNGFIGGNLARKLCESEKYTVTSFDCVIPTETVEKVEYVKGDFFDVAELKRMVEENDVIIHAISTINPGNSNEFYMRGYEKDFVQSARLCELIHNANKRLIFLSSGGTVYGQHEEMPISEAASCQPINHYGTVKRCIEIVMSAFFYQNGDDVIVARISNPYGTGQDYHKGVGVIDAILKNAINDTPVTIWGDGENIRDYIHINDVCGMISSLIEYDGQEHIFNLSSGKGYRINEIIEMVKKHFPQLKVVYQSGRAVDLRNIVLDNSKIREIYRNTMIPIEEGIEMRIREIEICRY